MTVYIGLLRGINVGGKNKIKMVELKMLLETKGFTHVQTYLQSGNVLFISEEAEGPLRRGIEQDMDSRFGVSPTVVLRTAEEFEQIVAACPYAVDALLEGESIQISVLTQEPPEQTAEILSNGKSSIDEFQIHGREIYFLFRQSVLDSKLASNIQKLGNTATTRNWNTMNKLAVLAKAMQA
ncbi:DUF1697 domain-containing protein [Paenibacillus sp. SYP-B3998]|uniref:DUF1697 domain-containing protein n=1 Tax=Paenibacillus sp. SYP-B3998 TaxID=2678564 RepID=A0A6G4A1D8_9BACL|nr:DUF1697 domain-containing protein [Paenibacillus sp. SYP-B3998]NEW07639.1 DUF1697 domain-containing protein [Paenibacillus sp. SYP-B3998]